jgi:hypothetical protein
MKVQAIKDYEEVLKKGDIVTVYALVNEFIEVLSSNESGYFPFYFINDKRNDCPLIVNAELFTIIDNRIPKIWEIGFYSESTKIKVETYYGLKTYLYPKHMVISYPEFKDLEHRARLWDFDQHTAIFRKRKAEIDAELGYMD